MSYKGYNGAETISYPYKQFKTWAEAWAEATAYDPEPRTPEVYRKPFRDYNTADDLMDPDTVGVCGTGDNREWVVKVGYC